MFWDISQVSAPIFAQAIAMFRFGRVPRRVSTSRFFADECVQTGRSHLAAASPYGIERCPQRNGALFNDAPMDRCRGVSPVEHVRHHLYRSLVIAFRPEVATRSCDGE